MVFGHRPLWLLSPCIVKQAMKQCPQKAAKRPQFREYPGEFRELNAPPSPTLFIGYSENVEEIQENFQSIFRKLKKTINKNVLKILEDVLENFRIFTMKFIQNSIKFLENSNQSLHFPLFWLVSESWKNCFIDINVNK